MHDTEKDIYDEEFRYLHKINSELGKANQKLNTENDAWALYAFFITLAFVWACFV